MIWESATALFALEKDGYHAAQAATSSCYEQGAIGAGTGATVGKWAKGKPMKGGFGIGISSLGSDILVAAFAVTNAVGDIVNPVTGQFYSQSGKQDLITAQFDPHDYKLTGLLSSSVNDVRPTNTTLAVIATNISLGKTELMKVAELAHDGMARAIYPVHTNLDGDVVFALSSHSGERAQIKGSSGLTVVDLVGLAAQDALVKAIDNSVLNVTESIAGFPACQKGGR